MLPSSIYEIEKDIFENENKVFVLSSFPEFLFDYFNVDFWNSHFIKTNKRLIKCRHVKNKKII